ncbi:MAG: hypothetical protein HYY32_03055 [Chloroflexi bacterium]|nr:hypothetical protein [Chloroflexota bacterium]
MAIKDRLRIISAVVVASLVAIAMGVWPSSGTSAAVAAAQITSFQVTGPDGKLITDEPLRAGAVYKVVFTVSVAAGINDKGILRTDLVRAPGVDHFWSLTGNYAGIDTRTWQPGKDQITFQAVEGEARLELIGQVPLDWVAVPLANDDIAHIARDINLVRLSLASGPALEDRALQVIDNLIGDYRQALASARAAAEDANADPRYVDFVKAVTEQAQAIGEAGYAQRAIDLLAAIPPAGEWVPPQGSTRYLWIITAVLAALAVLFVFISIRARGESSLVRSEVDEQAKRLEILSAKATRIGDTALANDINKVKSGLEKLAGR